MSDHDPNRPREGEDPGLDAWVRKAIRAGDREGGASLDDAETVLDYLRGDADEACAEPVRRILSESATARRDLVEISRDVNRLVEPEVRARFAEAAAAEAPSLSEFLGQSETVEASRPAAPEPRPSWTERLAGLLRTPAFAAAFTFAVMFYPTYRFFTDDTGRGRETPAVVETATVSLRSTSLLRGPELPPVKVSAPEGWIELTLWSEPPFVAGERHRLSVFQGTELVWQDEDFRALRSVDGSDAYVVLLNAALLERGLVRIEVETQGADGTMASSAEYSFVLE